MLRFLVPGIIAIAQPALSARKSAYFTLSIPRSGGLAMVYVEHFPSQMAYKERRRAHSLARAVLRRRQTQASTVPYLAPGEALRGKRRLCQDKTLTETEAAKGPPIVQVAREWLEACEAGRAERPPLEHATVQFYRGNVETHIRPQLGHLPIRSLTPDAVRAFRTHLLQESGLARISAKKVLATLKTLLGYAIEEGLISLDPAQKVKIGMSSRDRREMQIHSKADMSAILAAAARLRASRHLQVQRTWERYLPLLHVLVYAGLRLSEVRGLERDAVDVVSSVIVVRQRADKSGRIGSPKTRQAHRRVHIPDDTTEILKNWLTSHRHQIVFPTQTGHPLEAEEIRKRLWLVVQKEAQVRVLKLHSARHFFASRQIELGCNPKELAALMGHADEAFMLQTYGHLFQDEETEAKAKARANALLLVSPCGDNRGAAGICIRPKQFFGRLIFSNPTTKVAP